MKKIFILIAAGIILISSEAWSQPGPGGHPQAVQSVQNFRIWTYAGFNFEFTPNWAFTLTPGFNMELASTAAPVIGSNLFEIFAGPTFSYMINNFLIVVPLWYYYTGYYSAQNGSFSSSHNIALLPEVVFFTGRWSFGLRLYFQNLFYSSPINGDSGYALLLTEKLEIGFKINSLMKLIVADELFTTLVSNPYAMPDSGSPFYRQGITKNKFYAGIMWNLSDYSKLYTQYVLETNFNEMMRTTQYDHQLYILFTHSFKFYGEDARTKINPL